ncbi:unnamed protein product [Sphagnum jensenii]|uniref:Germin-like protein n=1 Tax=Sphagnum jensenii TaxID=128206 RepID=A0ABP1ACA3_9BRYO
MGQHYQIQGLLCLVVILVLVCIGMPVNASDPDPVVDNPANVKSFTLHNVFRHANVTTGPGGVRAALSTSNFPASIGQGITVVRFELLPCGVNVPHTHPRASELVSLISGGPMQVGFIDTAGEAHFDILYPGDATLFPRALLHFEINLGTKTASFVSALNSENPGTLIAGASLFRTPKAVLATALHSEAEVLEKIAKSISTNLVALQLANKEFCIPGKNVSLGVFQTGDLRP